MKCRFCGNDLTHEFIDLGHSPPSNSFLSEEELNQPEVHYPLKLFVCDRCFLVQIDEYKNSQEIFSDRYIYFASFSSTWLEHSKKYVDMIVKRLNLGSDSLVIEIASNDGYLLQYVKEKNIPCLGIEPSSATAGAAREKGIEVIESFFGAVLAEQLREKAKQADLIIGNNVLAHVPDINDFVKGLGIIIKPEGTITMEFPHLVSLIEKNQFDTIYHEHFSYLSLTVVKDIFNAHGMVIYDVEELPTHGGSLRIYAGLRNNNGKRISENVAALLEQEHKAGVSCIEYYKGYQERVRAVKYELLTFILREKEQGKRFAAYGAAAKGNTLFNYCGIGKDMIEYVVDASPHKQNKYLPGTHIPVVSEAVLKEKKPEYVLVLPWNIRDEIIEQLAYIREWGGKFVIAVPELIMI